MLIEIKKQEQGVSKHEHPLYYKRRNTKSYRAVLMNHTISLQGYSELKNWIKKEFDKEIKYNILLKYYILHFQSKVKLPAKTISRKMNLHFGDKSRFG